MQELTLRVGAWHGDKAKQYAIPDTWSVDVFTMRGAPRLDDAALHKAVANPVGCAPIATAAKGAESAVLIIDDLSRPTPGERICNALMDELNRADIPDRKIAILMGGGAHRPFNRREMAKKLGSARNRAARINCHDAWDAPCEFFGVTSRGTPILVNRIAAQAEFRVAISGAYPMSVCGFGGGNKMILPGVSHISSITWNHTQLPTGTRAGRPQDSVRRLDIEEYGGLFGLNMAVCAVVNAERELCGLVAGEPRAAHRKAVAIGRKVYYSGLDKATKKYDLNIVNAYPMDADGVQLCKSTWAYGAGGASTPTLFIDEFPDKYWYHGQYEGRFKDFARQDHTRPLPRQTTKDLMAADRILYNPHCGTTFYPEPNLYGQHWYYARDWDRLIGKLARRFPKARVRVIPAAAIQY